jgi:UDP-2,3-diacylglucosamine hydrolase
MRLYFISDLHLSHDDQHSLQAFRTFALSIIEENSRLYILGDLFDVWIGDDDNSSFTKEIILLFNELKNKSVTTFFCHGNRDFLLGEEFAFKASINLLEEFTSIFFNDQKVLMAHGDQFCTDDHAYQEFRSMVRSSKWKKNFLSKSLGERNEIALKLRKESIQSNNEKNYEIMDANLNSVDNLMQDQCIDILIHGHTHRPAFHDIKNKSGDRLRIVLGDWSKSEKVLLLTDQFIKICDIREERLFVVKEKLVCSNYL